jgi:hypothetical protein
LKKWPANRKWRFFRFFPPFSIGQRNRKEELESSAIGQKIVIRKRLFVKILPQFSFF